MGAPATARPPPRDVDGTCGRARARSALARALRSGRCAGARDRVPAAQRQGRLDHRRARGGRDRKPATARRHAGPHRRCRAARLRRVGQQGARAARPVDARGAGRDPDTAADVDHAPRRDRRGAGPGARHRTLDGGDDADVPARPAGHPAGRRPRHPQGHPARGWAGRHAVAETAGRAWRAMESLSDLCGPVPVAHRRPVDGGRNADEPVAGLAGPARYPSARRYRQCQGS